MARPRRHQAHARVRERPAPDYSKEKDRALSGVLLDSDVIIEILRGSSKISATLAGLERRGVPTYCTAISWAEIYSGVRRGEEPLTEAFFEARGEVVLDGRAGRHAGAYLARYRRSHGVEIADAMIAAAAATSGLRLWTLDRKHYPMSDLSFFQAPRERRSH